MVNHWSKIEEIFANFIDFGGQNLENFATGLLNRSLFITIKLFQAMDNEIRNW